MQDQRHNDPFAAAWNGGDGGPGSLFITAQDGLKLHVRSHGRRIPNRLTVVCLAGLTRCSADFDALAAALAQDAEAPRQVLALDYRGRGLSEYDRDPLNYTLATELSDLTAVLTALGVGVAVFVGTSRGGLLTMLLAAARPTVIAGAVLNDIGPVIEPTGLLRIKNYVGKLPRPDSYEEGAEILRHLFGSQFPKLSDDDWLGFSRRTFKIERRVMTPLYDVRIAKTLEGIEFDRPLPPLWREFDALGRVPLMVIRGGNSDLLSEATVAAMASRRKNMEAVVVPDQGHAPLLTAPDLIARIAAFVASCDAARTHEQTGRQLAES
jgi:pimeloyl-ACP methyl ester carboxylesterase